MAGLPGSVGSILVSRLSTSLHAAALTSSLAISNPLSAHARTPSIHALERAGPPKLRKEPDTQLVMTTLLLVTIPIEVVFLGTIHALGWLHLPMLFVAFAVVFFFCAVFLFIFLSLEIRLIHSFDR
jgi:solute carrier family 41